MANKCPVRRVVRVVLTMMLLIAVSIVGYRRGYRRGYEGEEQPAGTPLPATLYLVTYPVSDLIAPDRSSPLEGDGDSIAKMDQLIDLIVSTVEHDSWMENGTGMGEIQPFPSNQSLVIAQTKRVHEQIAELIAQLRSFNVSATAQELVPYLQSCAAYGHDVSTAFRTLPLNSKGRAAIPSVFDKSVQALADLWGPPEYRGEAGDADFPAWSHALQIAAWPRGDGLAYLAVQNQPGVGCVLSAGWRRAD